MDDRTRERFNAMFPMPVDPLFEPRQRQHVMADAETFAALYDATREANGFLEDSPGMERIEQCPL